MHPELQKLIEAMQSGDTVNVSALRAQIADVWPRLELEKDRVILLELREHFMDFVERQLAHDGAVRISFAATTKAPIGGSERAKKRRNSAKGGRPVDMNRSPLGRENQLKAPIVALT
jgi:hypothetical protein